MPPKLKLSKTARIARRRAQVRQSVEKWKEAHPGAMQTAQRRHYRQHAEYYREKAREYYWAHREEKLAYAHQRQQKHRDRLCADMRKFTRDSRLEVFEHYGQTCACCGEDTFTMLTIDHIGGCTAARRKLEGQGARLVRYLINHGFPPGYRILCFNCNRAAALNAHICPHHRGCFALPT